MLTRLLFLSRFSIARLAVMHLMATNSALCVRTLIEETWEDFLLDYLKSSMAKSDSGEGVVACAAEARAMGTNSRFVYCTEYPVSSFFCPHFHLSLKSIKHL